MEGGTGAFIETDDQERAFHEFLQHSSIEFLNQGAYGMTLKATLIPSSEYVSKYKMMDVNDFGREATSLVIKISVLGYRKNLYDFNDKYLQPIRREDFEREVNIQTDVFLKTMSDLQPLCPAIIYANVYENDASVLKLICSKMPTSKEKILLYKISNMVSGFTIIGMELLDKYDNMYSLLTKDPGLKRTFGDMASFMLIQLAMKTGYNHGDFHSGNVMGSMDESITLNTQFSNLPGRWFLIDFGMAYKMSKSQMDEIKALYERDEYDKIITFLCKLPRADGFDEVHKHDVYKYVCETPLDNRKIRDMFIANEQAREDRVATFNATHDHPKLPLSNAVKNKMFPGLIENVKYTVDLSDATEFPSLQQLQLITRVACEELNGAAAEPNEIVDIIVRSFYICCYLTNGHDELGMTMGDKMMRCYVSLYCSGMNDFYAYMTKSRTTIFNIFRKYVFPREPYLTASEIGTACLKYEPLLKDKHFQNARYYLSEENVEKLSSSNENDNSFKTAFMQNILKDGGLFYSNPEEWVNRNYPDDTSATPRATVASSLHENAEPEFVFPNKNPSDKFGGTLRKRKKLKRGKTSRKKSRRSRKHRRFK